MNNSDKDDTDEESVIAPQEVWEKLSEEEKDSVRDALIRIAEEMSKEYFEDATETSSTEDHEDEDN